MERRDPSDVTKRRRHASPAGKFYGTDNQVVRGTFSGSVANPESIPGVNPTTFKFTATTPAF
jgi:hypothetical protein